MNSFQPTESRDRMPVVDALRGLALFAILIANIPFSEGISSGTFVLGYSSDAIVNALFHLLIDKKFVAIFSILFGFGFYYQLRRAEDRRIDFRRYFIARMLLLLAIGCVHAYLLWFGDIIRDYALCGLLLLLIYKWPPKRILYTGIFFTIGLTALIFILNGVLELQEYDFDGTLVAEHPTTDSYSRYLKINATIDPFRNFIQDSPLTLVFSFGCMLVGVWMAQSNFILDSLKFRTTMTWLIILGIVAGLTCSYLFWMITIGDLELTPSLIWLPFLIVAGLFLQSLCYVSSFITLYRFVWFRKLVGFLVPVGRMPLTNYVLQSVFYLFIFFHCTGGLKLYGQLSQSETYLLCIPLFFLQAFVSHLWLDKFNQGPVEFLWKRLTYRLVFRSARAKT